MIETETDSTLLAETGATEITRFNALKHGVLSRYTVLPWEDTDEYRALLAALVAEHTPQGPTEEHLVEELVGILCLAILTWQNGIQYLCHHSCHSSTSFSLGLG